MALIRIQECSEQTGIFQAKISFNQGLEYEVIVRDPFSKEEEERLEWYFEEHVKFPFTDQVKVQEAATSVIKYGEMLFTQIFSSEPQILSEYKTTTKAGLHLVQIEILGQPSFHMLHWETLKDPELSLPLALQATIVRKNLSHQIVYTNACLSPTINLLVVTARPHGKQDIGYRTISRPLVGSLRQDRLPVKIDILRPGTYKTLETHLREVTNKYGIGYYHVIHFDVHGAVLPYSEIRHLLHKRYGRDKLQSYEGMKAFLFLEGEKDNTADPLEATELAKLLIAYHVPIAILNACQSGKQAGENEASLASHLMQSGIQMVLAMGYSVTVTAAMLLMKTLYQQLFDGNELSTAIRAARSELYNHKERQAHYNQAVDLEDWLLPVVYQNQPQRLTPRPFTPEEETLFWGKEAGRYQPILPTYGFIGRDLDILQIEKRLLSKRNLLLIQGMGGAGKTTLLQHLAEWWQKTSFTQQVFYFGYDEQAWSRQQLLNSIAVQLLSKQEDRDTFRSLDLEAQQAMLTGRLRAERHVLILDNLESIVGSQLVIQHTLSPQEQRGLRSLLTGLVGSRTLVLLGSRGKEEWLAPGTFEDNVYELGGLDPEAASILVNSILERNGVTKYQNDPDLQQLLKLLDGFPLALKVILANLTRQTPKQVFSALQLGSTTLQPGKEQSKTENILLCIDYSFRNLSLDIQSLLVCLAPFTSILFLPVLDTYVTALKQQPVLVSLPFDRWQEMIQVAMNWGLLTSDAAAPGFLRLHPVLPYFLRRLYATGREEIEMRKAVEITFREFYDQLGPTLRLYLNSKDSQERQLGQAFVRLEYENLCTAIRRALDAQVSILGSYIPFADYIDRIQAPQQGLAFAQNIWQHLNAYPAKTLTGPLGIDAVSVLDSIARWQAALKQYADAEVSYQRALTILMENTSMDADTLKKRSAPIYHQLGMVAQEQRQWEQAEQYYRKTLQIKIDFNDRREQASTYHQLGRVAQEQRQWERAEQYYQKTLQIRADFNDHEQAATYGQLGNMALEQRQWAQAEQYYRKALQIHIDFNDHHSQASTYHNLSMVAQQQGELKQAKQYLLKALQIQIDFNNHYEQAGTYHQLGNVAEEQGQWEQAEQYYQKALQIRIDFNDHEQADTYHQLGIVAQKQQQWAQAEQYYQKALQIKIGFNDRHSQAGTYLQLGKIALEQQQLRQAEQYLLKALQIKIGFNDRYKQDSIYGELGNVAMTQQQWEQAEQYYLKALQYIDFNDHDEQAGIAQAGTYHNLGNVAMAQQQWEQAEQYYLKALRLFVKYGEQNVSRATVYYLARLWKATNDIHLPTKISVILNMEPREIEQLLRTLMED